jgi:hypothetical protein
VTVQTSVDVIASVAAASGVIGGAVTSVTFSVAAGDRVAGNAGSAATFTFTPTAGGSGPSAVTLNCPEGFFIVYTATPTATLSTVGSTLNPSQPGATFIAMTTGGTPLAAGTAEPSHFQAAKWALQRLEATSTCERALIPLHPLRLHLA